MVTLKSKTYTINLKNENFIRKIKFREGKNTEIEVKEEEYDLQNQALENEGVEI